MSRLWNWLSYDYCGVVLTSLLLSIVAVVVIERVHTNILGPTHMQHMHRSFHVSVADSSISISPVCGEWYISKMTYFTIRFRPIHNMCPSHWSFLARIHFTKQVKCFVTSCFFPDCPARDHPYHDRASWRHSEPRTPPRSAAMSRIHTLGYCTRWHTGLA